MRIIWQFGEENIHLPLSRIPGTKELVYNFFFAVFLTILLFSKSLKRIFILQNTV